MRKCILVLYAKSKKRFGAEKMKICLKRDYRINISSGRAYRLMKAMNLPKMSTVKPFKHKSKSDSDGECKNIFSQKFNQMVTLNSNSTNQLSPSVIRTSTFV